MHAISRTSSRLIGGFEKCVAPVEDDSRDRVNDFFFSSVQGLEHSSVTVARASQKWNNRTQFR